jgi:hypothetical protein
MVANGNQKLMFIVFDGIDGLAIDTDWMTRACVRSWASGGRLF